MKALLIACAIWAASSSCFAVATALDDCKKEKVTTVATPVKRALHPAPAASAPKAVKKKRKPKVEVVEEPCPPLTFPTPFSFIPPPDAVTIPPDAPLLPQEAPPALSMVVYPFGPECFCEQGEGGGFYGGPGYYGGGGGGGGGIFVPPPLYYPLPPAPEPHEWFLFIAGLACIGVKRCKHTHRPAHAG